MTQPETLILAELIARKRQCLLTLCALGRRQAEFIRADNMNGLLEVLAAKQRSLLELQSIERGLEPYRGQAADERAWPDDESRRQCAEHLRHCELLLAEIVAEEQRCEQALTARRDAVAIQLQGMNLGSAARGAYLASPPDATYHQLDLASDS